MFDVIGVGICIACISYLCCIYTTTLMARSTANSFHRPKRCNIKSPLKKSSPEPAAKYDDMNIKYSKSTRRRCLCTKARCIEQSNFSVPMARRRICLVASSFFDTESTEGKEGT
ncbi:uncharacterized protein LOC131670726 [Phymastichus coffea]|uniref:uncharacterized protein LOC131670726 n=1 Tax=Phymastichus coffea TaxID=108790 RepID=UPI00273B5ED6|nr:uncharacterized protein LOC131670726 [Phymastichus coffea]